MTILILPNGARPEVAAGGSVADALKSAAPKLLPKALAARSNGTMMDLSAPLPAEGEVNLILRDSPEAGDIIRHSTAHIMADAVRRLFGPLKLAIGPAIENGFYYDFDMEHKLVPDDLPKIEAEMAKIVAEDLPFQRRDVPRNEALSRLSGEGESYKVEIVREIQDPTVSFYSHGDFTDLCRGPHLPSTGKAGAFRLLSIAGAYWRGDSKNRMLQRIYGAAFASQQEMDAHLKRLEEAKARDHRVLGKQLDIFSVNEDVGPGLILWHPNGAMIRHLIESFWRDEHIKRGYNLVYTPHIASERIYKISGHLEKYAEMMYAPMMIDEQAYYIKPMNCPAQYRIFQSRTRSYRDLPIRYAELGTVYRYEPSGTLHGMLRVRGFTQDDAHSFCTPEQLPQELDLILELMDFMMKSFGYTYKAYLSTRPEKYIGTPEEWERATEELRQAMRRRGLDFEVDEGGGTFYAPKIDIKLIDSTGREWQGPTHQVDLQAASRFDINYVGADNSLHRPIIIHRTVLGSMERFIGGLIEHYAGAFPLWLAPEQARVLAVSEQQADYARQVATELRAAGFRASADVANEKIGAKIRNAQMDKVPYMAVVGAREASAGAVAVRHRKAGDQGAVPLAQFIERMRQEAAARSL